MNITFLGTNGWFDTSTGNTICTLVRSKQCNIIFDAGNGIHKIDKYIDYSKDTFLFLSHFHLDHIIGLHMLNKFKFKKRFVILGQKGTKRILNKLIAPPFTISFPSLKYDVEFIELGEGKHAIPLDVECRPLFHSEPSMGYRITVDGKTISYCLDTGPCDNLIELSKDADMMITECSFPAGMYVKGWPHLNPELAANAARQANAERLALTHFDASIYKGHKDRLKAQGIARRIFPGAFVARDDMRIEL
jgi:ribonuclease BN (tRNA processing enzyme)